MNARLRQAWGSLSSRTRKWVIVLTIAALHFGAFVFVARYGTSFDGPDSPIPFGITPYAEIVLSFPLLWLVLGAAVFIAPSPMSIALAVPFLAANSLIWGIVGARLIQKLRARQPGTIYVIGLLAVAILCRSASAQGEHTSTVGMPARIEELVLPGTELEAAPTDANSALVVRITRVSPHGSLFRYDLEYYGLDPGEYDLRTGLRRKDGSTTDDLPPIPVTVRTLLPAGQVKPHVPAEGAVPSLGGYRTVLIAAGVVWLAGLIILLRAGRKRRQELGAARARPRTLAERLRPLVERAREGTLSRTERAQLELGLVAYWRRKLGLEERRPEDALAVLRQHAEAGPLLTSLEQWLHMPTPPAEVDLAALLAPYRDLPPDAIDVPEPSPRAMSRA